LVRGRGVALGAGGLRRGAQAGAAAGEQLAGGPLRQGLVLVDLDVRERREIPREDKEVVSGGRKRLPGAAFAGTRRPSAGIQRRFNRRR
jgi:hypothetical protein